MKLRLALMLALAALTGAASAHDIWIEPSTDLVRMGDWLRLSLMLGNHGNEHRDFRLASKVGADSKSLAIFDPQGVRHNVTSSLVDAGMAPDEGYWTAKYAPTMPGLYMAASTFDHLMTYAPVRDIKCAKAFFVASEQLDRVPVEDHGYDRVLGAPLELVLHTEPGVAMSAGRAVKVEVIYQGKPLKNTVVSFVPRGSKPSGDFDPLYQKRTGADGTVSMILREANTYLISTHITDEKAKGKGYNAINYSATICLLVH